MLLYRSKRKTIRKCQTDSMNFRIFENLLPNPPEPSQKPSPEMHSIYKAKPIFKSGWSGAELSSGSRRERTRKQLVTRLRSRRCVYESACAGFVARPHATGAPDNSPHSSDSRYRGFPPNFLSCPLSALSGIAKRTF